MNLKDKVLKYASFILVLLIPVVYFGGAAYPSIAPKIFFFYGAVELMAAFWIYALLTDPEYRLTKKTLLYFIPIFAFVAWMTVSGVMAVNPRLAFWGTLARGTGLIVLYHAFIFSVIMASLFKKFGKEYLYRLMKWFVAGGFLLSITIWFGASGFKLPYQWSQTDGGGGLTGNSSLAAAYLLFAIAFGIILLLSRSVSKKEKWLTVGALTVTIFSPLFINLVFWMFSGQGLMGNARGATIGMFSGVAAALVIYAIFSGKKTWRAIGIILVIAGIASFSYLWNRLVTPGTSLHETFVQDATGTRFIFWNVGSEVLQDSPWFGYGPENYMIAFQRHFDYRMLEAKYNHEVWNDRAHNIYYQTGTDGGYPAIVLYALFLAGILFALYKAYKKERLSLKEACILAGLIVGYVIQNLVYFDSTISLMALFLVAGTAYGFQFDTAKQNEEVWKLKSIPIQKITSVIIFIFFALAFIVFAWNPFMKDIAYVNAFEHPSEQSFKALEDGSSIGEDWDVSGFANDMYKFYASHSLSIKSDKARNERAIQSISYTLNYLEWLAPREPYDFRLYASMVLLYNTRTFLSNASYDSAQAEHLLALLAHAEKLSPGDPEMYWNEAQIMAWKGDLQAAANAYEKAIEVAPKLSVSHELLIKFARALGDKNLYNFAVDQAKKYVPNFVIPN